MSDQPPGPSRDTLKNLAGMLPSFTMAMKGKKITGKGAPLKILRPRKVCPVCGDLYDKVMLPPNADLALEPKNCERCQGLLDEKWTAFTCGENYAFARSPGLVSMAGQMVQISPSVFEQLAKEFDVHTKQKPTGDTQDA